MTAESRSRGAPGLAPDRPEPPRVPASPGPAPERERRDSPLSVTAWARRTAELHRELAAIAEVDPRWWLVAGGVAAAETWARPDVYLACDAEPDADTFMGYRAAPPSDLVHDAITRARAARTVLRELDGQLPDQPLAVTIDQAAGAQVVPSALDSAAFAVGDRCLIARLDDPALAAQLAAVLGGATPRPWRGAAPFVCVTVGDEPLDTVRHGHRRAWTTRGGPWLGLSRAGDLAVVSTCHLAVDGYGHARIAARVAALTAASRTAVAPGAAAAPIAAAPPLSPVAGAVPLAIAWRALPGPAPRVIPMAYTLGRILHRIAGRPGARFSPTFQIPVARGAKDDPMRLRRRIVSLTASVRFDGGAPEPFAAFEARLRDAIRREAAAHGLVSRLLAAARAAPIPLAWKRRSISAKRPRWFESFAEVIGGRALLSRIAVDAALPAMCAASSPARMATAEDPTGGCVITLIDDGVRSAITVAGSGFAGTPERAAQVIDELLAPG